MSQHIGWYLLNIKVQISAQDEYLVKLKLQRTIGSFLNWIEPSIYKEVRTYVPIPNWTTR